MLKVKISMYFNNTVVGYSQAMNFGSRATTTINLISDSYFFLFSYFIMSFQTEYLHTVTVGFSHTWQSCVFFSGCKIVDSA